MHALDSGIGFLTVSWRCLHLAGTAVTLVGLTRPMTSRLRSRDLRGGFYWSGDSLYDYGRGGRPFTTYISFPRAMIGLSSPVSQSKSIAVQSSKFVIGFVR